MRKQKKSILREYEISDVARYADKIIERMPADIGISGYIRALNPDLFDFMPYNDVIYSIHISLKSKIIYFEIPKNASTSIKRALRLIELYPNSIYLNLHHEVHERRFSPFLSLEQAPTIKVMINDPKFFCFTVVRDPIERIRSVYLDKIRGDKPEKMQFLKFIGVDDPLHHVSFFDFVNTVCGQNLHEANIHWRQQYFQSFYYIFNCMKVYSIRNLRQLADDLASHTGFSGKIDIEHSNSSHATENANIYGDNRELIDEMIKAKYQSDYRAFGEFFTSDS